MSKHTPGPWTVEEFPSVQAAQEQGWFEWAGDKEEWGPVGLVWKRGERGGITGLPGSVETTLANARLIAAAPDLLDALRDLVATACAVDDYEGVPEAVNRARAAIARATEGGS